MDSELEKIDVIRERTGVSYRKAREALEAAGGDVVEALIALEEEERVRRQRFDVRGSEIVEKVKGLIREGTVRRIVIKSGDRTVFEIPVAVGAIGALLMPTLAALGVLAAMLTEASIIVERRVDGEDTDRDAGADPGSPASDVDTL